MKMARADEKDITAAGDLLVILNDLSSGRYPVIGEPGDDTPEWFDADDRSHLRHLHDLLAGILDRSPGFQARVIAGMCYVILYSKNRIVDLTADTLELHPDHVSNAEDAARYRWVRQHWGRIVDTYHGDSGRIESLTIEPAGSPEGWDVDADSLDAAIDAARKEQS